MRFSGMRYLSLDEDLLALYIVANRVRGTGRLASSHSQSTQGFTCASCVKVAEVAVKVIVFDSGIARDDIDELMRVG